MPPFVRFSIPGDYDITGNSTIVDVRTSDVWLELGTLGEEGGGDFESSLDIHILRATIWIMSHYAFNKQI